ncbi:hypothetical protein B938_01075 [Bacillus velezensis AS43.3]|nr:hypothetical protein B938_01075 [Bacillus velezensis AS43.3]RAP14628.1 hypothetical protein C2W63_03861 [Bacillus velezensis]
MSWVQGFIQGEPHHGSRTNAEREALIGKDLAMTIDTKTTK